VVGYLLGRRREGEGRRRGSGQAWGWRMIGLLPRRRRLWSRLLIGLFRGRFLDIKLARAYGEGGRGRCTLVVVDDISEVVSAAVVRLADAH
jgi:hypothetical protein